MISSFDAPSLAAGSLIGIAGAYVVVPLALAFLSSTDWVSLGVATTICAVAAAGYLPRRAKGSVRDAFRLPPRDADGSALASPPVSPRDWLRQARAFPPVQDDAMQAALIGESLADQIRDQPHYGGGLGALEALLVAFCAGAAGYAAFDELAQLMREPEGRREPALREFIRRMYAFRAIDGMESGNERTHHYHETRIVGLFVEALKRKPIRTSDVLWLKHVHRALWYALDNVGRRACHVEGMGITAHFLAERTTGKGMGEPKVRRAVQALAEYARDAVRNQDQDTDSPYLYDGMDTGDDLEIEDVPDSDDPWETDGEKLP